MGCHTFHTAQSAQPCAERMPKSRALCKANASNILIYFTTSTMSKRTLEVNPLWDAFLSNDSSLKDLDQDHQCQLVFSLILHLNLSVRDFIFFIFESQISTVKHRAGLFMAHKSPETFAPSKLYSIWHAKFKNSRSYLHEQIIKPCSEEIILQESNLFIEDNRFKVPPKSCTVDQIMDILDPGKLATHYEALVPFTWKLLMVFTASPNRYRTLKASTKARELLEMETSEEWAEDNHMGSTPLPEEFAGETGKYWAQKGFVRNATFVSIICQVQYIIDLIQSPDHCFCYQHDGIHAQQCIKSLSLDYGIIPRYRRYRLTRYINFK